MLRFSVSRSNGRWSVYRPDLTLETMLATFPTRKAAILAILTMIADEQVERMIARGFDV